MQKIKDIDAYCFQRYWWSKNLAIWLDESILSYNLETRIFPDIQFSQENKELQCLFFLATSSKTQWQNFMKSKKTPFWALFADFGANKNFSGKPDSLFSVFRFLLLCRISEKTKEQNSRKVGYRRTDGRIHGRTDKPLPGVQKQQGSKVNYIKVSWLNIYPQSCKKYLQ